MKPAKQRVCSAMALLAAAALAVASGPGRAGARDADEPRTAGAVAQDANAPAADQGAGAQDANAPAAAGAGRTTGSVQSADGVTIRYEVAGQGEPALVFVHGWSCDRSYWRGQVERFSASHRTVAIDLAGHGESGVDRKDWTMAAFAGDVRAVVEALDLRRVVLIGHSMGGPVTVEAARLMPGRVAALVPVDAFVFKTPPEMREGFLPPFRTDFRGTTEAIVRQHMFTPRSDPALVERVAKDMASAPPEVGIGAMENFLRLDEGAVLGSAQVPVRLINADAAPTDLALWRKHKPDVSLAVQPGVGHFLMLEAPDEFDRLLERAVAELTDRP